LALLSSGAQTSSPIWMRESTKFLRSTFLTSESLSSLISRFLIPFQLAPDCASSIVVLVTWLVVSVVFESPANSRLPTPVPVPKAPRPPSPPPEMSNSLAPGPRGPSVSALNEDSPPVLPGAAAPLADGAPPPSPHSAR